MGRRAIREKHWIDIKRRIAEFEANGCVKDAESDKALELYNKMTPEEIKDLDHVDRIIRLGLKFKTPIYKYWFRIKAHCITRYIEFINFFK